MSSSPAIETLRQKFGFTEFNVLEFMRKNKEMINSIIMRYRPLDEVTFSSADLWSAAALAVTRAIASYDSRRSNDMKLESYIYWYIQKEFQAMFTGKDKIVQIITIPGERVVEELTYPTYLKRRRKLEKKYPKGKYAVIIKTRREDSGYYFKKLCC